MSSTLSDEEPTIVRPGLGAAISSAPQEFAPTMAAGERPEPEYASQPKEYHGAGMSGNALPVGTRLGDFELTGVLGEGGFGIVYIAIDHSLERQVALKEYMPSSLATRNRGAQVEVRSERHIETFEAGRRSFVNEARLLARFDHPSLVKVYQFWEANGTAYMVMPLYAGVTLKDKLRSMMGPPDEAWLMALLAPLTEALAILHAENCFHRDIAPDNVILLPGSDRPVLLDFGAARRVIGDMTQVLTVILKPGYAPVEQYAEAPNMKQGPWTDIYALGASIHYAIVGKTPPPSVSRLMGDEYVSLAVSEAQHYSARFLRAIDNALKVHPNERTRDVNAFRADLGLGAARLEEPHAQTRTEPVASVGPTVVAAGAATGTALSRRSGFKSLPLVVGAAVLCIAGALAYFFAAKQNAPIATKAAPPAADQAVPAVQPAVVAAEPPAQAAPEPVRPVQQVQPVQTPAPPTAAVAPFDVDREFDQILAAQTPGFGVNVSSAKPKLRIGRDRLNFSVTSDRDGYLTVLVLGPDGSLLQLFPNSKATQNKVSAAKPVKLPDERVWPLDTFPPTGRERFLAIVSREPRDYSALSTTREFYFLKLPTGDAALPLVARSAGGAPILLGDARNCSGSQCNEYGAAQFEVEVTDR